MRKHISYIMLLVLMITMFISPIDKAYAAPTLSMSVSKSTVNIGEEVVVSITVPGGYSADVDISYDKNLFVFQRSSGTSNSSGSVIQTTIGDYGASGGATTGTVTFKAISSGSGTFSASVTVAGDMEGNPVEIGGASASVTVANQTSAPEGNGGGGSSEPQKSADNSLSSLKLSAGSLSPSFKPNTTKYTASVDYSVTKVVVSAKTSNSKAVIESVTGDGTVNLEVGKNTIEIVVRAENGLKATYTVVVTRKAEAESEPQPSETESEELVINEMLQWNGEQLQATDNIPQESVPVGFESISLVVNGQQMQGLSFSRGDLKVLYLNNTNGAGSLYVYDEVQQTIYPFIKIESERSYVMILLPNEETEPVPEGFENCTLSIEGKGLVNAYQLKEDAPVEKESLEDSTMSWNLFEAENFYAAEAKASEFYLIYCMNDAGEKGWYMYDAVEGTFQRYLALVHSVQANGELSDSSNEEYAQLEKELKTAKMTQYIIIGIAIAVVIILIIVIVVLVLKKRSGEEDFFDEYEDEDEYEEEDVDDYVDEVIEGISQSIAEESEDGVYVNTMIDKKDDDDDLEFIDFE